MPLADLATTVSTGPAIAKDTLAGERNQPFLAPARLLQVNRKYFLTHIVETGSFMSKIVERTLDLLELFGREMRPLSLSEISSLLKIPMSSCHDVVRTMQSRGYLYEIAPRAGYYPTLRMCELGKEIRDNDPILMRTRVLLRSLRDTLDKSVLLSKVSEMNATYLLVFETINPLRVRVKIGDNVRSLHANSEGKALLASLDERTFVSFSRPLSSDLLASIPSNPQLPPQGYRTRKAEGMVSQP